MVKKINILIFGGTTEGKKAAWLLDQIGHPYIYSTKSDSSQKVKGKHISGALNQKAIIDLCKDQDIKLIIDAAHPFATELHSNILQVAEIANIEIVRFERNFTDLSNYQNIRLFSDFKSLEQELLVSGFHNILALTGVQTINKLQKVWQAKQCVFRILPTPQSKAIANKTGIPKNCIIAAAPERDEQSFLKLIHDTKAEVVISKESGDSGFFKEKAQAANKAKVPLWVVAKPQFEGYSNTVDSLKQLQSLIYKLQKGILKNHDTLTHGYTTGSCVTAAAKAALLSLLQDKSEETVDVQLPCGETSTFVTYCKKISNTEAICTVIKNAGDDPDITHSEEFGCRVKISNNPGIKIIGGKGIGKVTLPGLQVPVGESAINPVPRKMLNNALNQLLEKYECNYGLVAEPFVPRGEELAEKTFNPKIGVLGGISILGTTGRVEPYSNEAFLASIKKQLQVAKAVNCNSIVLTSGLRSENKIKPCLPDLPKQAFIHFGNLVGDTLKLCTEIGFDKIYIGLMLGKAIKLAEGHLNTHSKKVTFNAEFASNLAKETKYSINIINQINGFKLANAITNIIPFKAEEPFYNLIEKKCVEVCKNIVNDGIDVEFLLLNNTK